MTGYMYDGAYSPDLALCKRRGGVAASHYMTSSYAGTSAQPRAIRAAGMGVILNWEGTASELVGESRAQGQADAREALASIDPACPRDGSVAVYFSVDVAVYGAPYSDVDEAFRGINDVMRPAGFQTRVYGEGAIINHLVAAGLVQGKQWLSMSASFPGFDTTSPNVCLIQMHNPAGQWIGTDIPGTDRNYVTDPHDLAAWWPTGSPYATPGDTMSAADVITALQSKEGQKLLQDAVWGKRFTSPLDPTSKQSYSAAQFLVGGWLFSHDASGQAHKLVSAASKQAAEMLNLSTNVANYAKTTAVDVAAVAAAIKDKLVASINGPAA